MSAEVRADAPMAIVPSWIEVHCRVPDGFRRGRPFRLYDGQLRWFSNFYLVKGTAEFNPLNPVYAPAFRYRRGLDIGPQGIGKSPKSAAQICLEAVGPSVFAGWAGVDDGYACSDHGCGCGWEYPYEPGEPMGMLRPTPWIQIIAVSEDGTDNVYKALRPMIELGPLAYLMPKTGEGFIRLPGDGLIETATSSDTSRVGARGTFVVETEVGFYTPRNGMTKVADTLHRNLAKMSARAGLESNSWDPSQHSTAQTEYELATSGKFDDIYVQVTWPPKNLSFSNKAERKKIIRIVYDEDTWRQTRSSHHPEGGHVDLDAIEAEAVALAEKDPAQASRFFGNGRDTGSGAAFDPEKWKGLAELEHRQVAPGAAIAIGFDGSKRWDHTAMIATEIATGYQWPLGIWRPELYPGHEIPAAAVTATLEQAIADFAVWRVYADPPYWDETVNAWKGRWPEVVQEWWTNRIKPMAFAIRNLDEAMSSGSISHCAEDDSLCGLFSEHVGNAHRAPAGIFDDDRRELWLLTKERPGSPAKIDASVAAVLSWEARMDGLAAGVLNAPVQSSAYSRYHSLTGEDLDLGEELDALEVDPSDPDQHGPFVDELDDVDAEAVMA